MRRLIALALVVSALAACGTKGALYLPPPESGDDAAVAKKKR